MGEVRILDRHTQLPWDAANWHPRSGAADLVAESEKLAAVIIEKIDERRRKLALGDLIGAPTAHELSRIADAQRMILDAAAVLEDL